MNKLNYKNKNIFFILILCFFSIAFNFYYGYRGIFPTDSFLIFDSGYYVLNGFHPFKDYWTVTGPLLDYLQALFFLIFGTSWFSYVLHAAIINLTLAIFSYFVFVQLGLKKVHSFAYSTGISLLAYPIIGTPFVDHHSIIFSIFAIYCFILGIEKNKNIYWFLIPLFLGCSFLSKQIPASYIIIFILLMLLLFLYYSFNIKKISLLVIGTFFTLSFFALILIINQIPLNNFLIQYFLYPMTVGSSRVESLNFDLKVFIGHFKYIYICLIPLFVVLLKMVLKNKKTLDEKKDFTIILTIIGMTLIFIYAQLLTKNQILIFFIIPLVTAFSHIYFFKYFSKKYFIYFIILICLFSVTKYHFRYNEQKKFMELENANFDLAIKAGKIHKIFNGLQWITAHYLNDPTKEVNKLIEIKDYINSDLKNKIIISDYQFFSAISNSKFDTLIKWNKWYDAVSVPHKENKYFSNYQKFFIKKIKKNKIKEIYAIGNDNKFIYFEDLIDNVNCINSKSINEMLIIYDISNCDL